MSDLLDSIADLFHKTVKTDAYTRKDRLPISITHQPGWEVSGEYGDFGVGQKIWLNSPQNNASGADNELQDVLKHELVHHILRKADLPTQTQYKDQYNFKGTPTLGPSNMWGWEANGRAGNPQTELPAYMSIYRPEQLPAVGPQARQQYMGEFMEWLKKIGQGGAAGRIQDLMRGRAAYADPATGKER